MATTRRSILNSMALGTAAAALPRCIRADFPAQSSIDDDPLRPRYHLMPRRGWMNDPCAPVYFEGRYHLFFQYNPGASVWGDMHWAHAVSADMVHWHERPIALAPTPAGPDSYGVFTGSMVIDHASGRDVPTVLYTCVAPSPQELSTLSGATPPEREQQCLARPSTLSATDPDARLDGWAKLPTPVITSPPTGMRVTGFRDPTPWREQDGWYMLLASGQYRLGGNVLLYKSQDLRRWEFQHIFAEGKWTGKETPDTVDSGEMWECPDFFPLGASHVLIHSTGTPNGRQTLWQSGRLDKKTMQFTVRQEGLLNHGPYYAPKTQLDAHGKRILWGWLPEDRPEAEFARAGWAGCMSLPRVLTLADDELRFQPAPEVNSLRAGTVKKSLRSDSSPLQSEALFVLTSADAEPPEEVLPTLHLPGLVIEPGEALLWNGKPISLRGDLPERLEIRIFVDRSVFELFLGDRAVLTHRSYSPESKGRLMVPRSYKLTQPDFYSLQAT